MIEKSAMVVEADTHYVWVEAADDDSCSHCSAKQGCGTASLQKWFKRKPNRLRVKNDSQLRSGDKVVIGIPEQAILQGSFLLYLMPLLFMFAGAVMGHKVAQWLGWSNPDLLSIVGAVGVFLAGYLLIRRYRFGISGSDGLQPVIVRRII